MKKTAIKAAQAAGKILLKEFKTFERKDVKFKQKHDVITQADLNSEKTIIEIIRSKFPNHQILSEEKGLSKKKSDYLWIVDPLDGTTNFSIKSPLFSVSIALAFKNETILGVIWAPYLKELYVVEKGKGAFLNGKKIKVSEKKKVSESFLTYCHGSKEKHVKEAIRIYKKMKLKSLDVRQFGSAALELGFVAVGRTESIVIPGANLWDVAAGILIVREAGGRVTDFQGKEWDLKSTNMLASNGKIHQTLLKLIKK